MARTVAAVLTANVSQHNTALNSAAASMERYAKAAVGAGAQADASLLRAAGAADKAAVAAGRYGEKASSGLDAAARSATKLDSLSTAISKSEHHINSLSRGAGLFGIAVAAGVGVAVNSYANFDQAISSVAATGSDARQNLDALRQAAIDAGASTVFSATEAAAGVENLAKAGVSAKDTLGGGLKGALDLAAAGGLDVASAAETAATAMTQFNLRGSDVPHIADLIAAGAGKAQGEVSDLAAALKQSGLVASQFGLSIEDTTGTLAAFASAGLIGSDAGTSLKTMLISLANPSKESAAEMKRLGIAAYDAQGNFVGVTNLAEQLQTRLAHLRPEIRDAALAQIFGNDAIRAANVLYEQGGKGIAGWIKNVNDQGYAAETAATKLDNLKGDLEGLSGAFETALIGLGEGSDGPLRSLVQGATGAVNAFNDLGDGTKSTALVVAGSLAGMALGAAAIGKLAVAANEAKIAFQGLGLSAKTAQLSIPVAGIALAALTTGVGHFMVRAADSAASVDSFEQALSGMTGEIDRNTAALNTNVRAQAASDLQKAGAFDQANKLGVSLSTLTDAALGNAQAVATVHAAIGTALRDGSGDAVKAALGLGRSLTVVSENEQKAIANARDLAAANLEMAGSSDSVAGSLKGAETALLAMKSSGSGAAGALDDLATSMFAAANAALTLSGNQIAFEASIDAATESIKTNGRTLDVNTEKGRANKTALNGIAAASNAYIASLVEQGASTKEVTAATQNARNSFVDAAQKAGLGAAAAKNLADKYGLVPENVKTDVSAPGAVGAKAEADRLDAAIRGLPKDVQTQVRSAFDRGGVDAALRALRSIDGRVARTVIITENRTVSSSVNRGVIASAKAAGGPILGPGTKTSDDVPIWASNGEYMQRAAAVDHYGLQVMDALNRRMIPRSLFSSIGLAGGGLVGPGATGLAAGGPVPPSQFGSSSHFNVAAIVALIRAIENPIRDLTKATQAVAAAQAAANAANRAASGPKGRLDTATDRYEAARDKRDAERAKNARELAKQKERVARAQKEYDRLDKAGDKTKGRTAADIRAEKAKADLDRARDKRDKISRQNTAEMARLNARVTETSKAKTKAQADYNTYADRAKVATDRLKDAQKNLADQQKQVADSARQISETFAGKYQSGSTDAKDWLDSKKNGAADLIKFNAQIMALRKIGLNETDIQAIINQPGGGTVAQQIIDGGTGLVKSLNEAQKKLQDAADKLGYNAATGVGRYAGGGPLYGPGTGTSDSFLIAASNGEYMQRKAAVDHYGLGFMNAVNSLQYPRRNFVDGYAGGGSIHRPAQVNLADLQAAMSGMRIDGELTLANGRAYIEGVATAVVDGRLATAGSNAQYRRVNR
jgi:TP901 family phage tail tape measure protein